MNDEHSTSRSEPRTLNRARLRPRAFTLIELLVVIAIIGILAALIFPAGAAVKRKATIKRVEGELGQLANAIETYKIDKGFYPPENSANRTVANENGLYFNVNTPASINSLYYELAGAEVVDASNTSNLRYETLDGGARITATELGLLGVGGLMNANVGRNDANVAKNYIQSFKPAQYSDHEVAPGQFRIVMSTVVKGPEAPDSGPSRFCYVPSSRWQRNPQTFDLWVDVIVGGKTNRISNWSEKPEIVSY